MRLVTTCAQSCWPIFPVQTRACVPMKSAGRFARTPNLLTARAGAGSVIWSVLTMGSVNCLSSVTTLQELSGPSQDRGIVKVRSQYFLLFIVFLSETSREYSIEEAGVFQSRLETRPIF